MILPTEIVRCDHCGGSFLAGDLETLRRNGYHDPATREAPPAPAIDPARVTVGAAPYFMTGIRED